MARLGKHGLTNARGLPLSAPIVFPVSWNRLSPRMNVSKLAQLGEAAEIWPWLVHSN